MATRTTEPSVTGTSVIAVKYNGGVMIASDTLGSYGSLARFRNLQRVVRVGSQTLVAASGEFSDFQAIEKMLDELVLRDEMFEDGATLTPSEIYAFLSRVMYNRRSKVNPLWNSLIVAGKDFLGLVDMYGTAYADVTLATGYGAYIARPLLRQYYRDTLTEAEARTLLTDCMRVLYYRDARSHDKIHLSVVDANGPRIEEPVQLTTRWDHPQFVYAHLSFKNAVEEAERAKQRGVQAQPQ